MNLFYLLSVFCFSAFSLPIHSMENEKKSHLYAKITGYVGVGGIANTALFRYVKTLSTEYKSLRKAIKDPAGQKLCAKSTVSAIVLSQCLKQASQIYQQITYEQQDH